MIRTVTVALFGVAGTSNFRWPRELLVQRTSSSTDGRLLLAGEPEEPRAEPGKPVDREAAAGSAATRGRPHFCNDCFPAVEFHRGAVGGGRVIRSSRTVLAAHSSRFATRPEIPRSPPCSLAVFTRRSRCSTPGPSRRQSGSLTQ